MTVIHAQSIADQPNAWDIQYIQYAFASSIVGITSIVVEVPASTRAYSHQKIATVIASAAVASGTAARRSERRAGQPALRPRR